jgi:hypothetical protein
MGLHEKMKNAKIVEELFGYLLEYGFTSINLSMDILDTETTFGFDVAKDNMDFINHFKQDLFCCRDLELEEYSWELMGENDCACTLNTLGTLIDRYDILEEEKVFRILLHRNK